MNLSTPHFKDIINSRSKGYLENAAQYSGKLVHAHIVVPETVATKAKLQGLTVQSGIVRFVKTFDGHYLVESNKAILPPGNELPNRLTIDDIINLLQKPDNTNHGVFLKIIHQNSGAGLEIKNISELMLMNPEVSLAAEAAIIVKRLEAEGTVLSDPKNTERVKQVVSEVKQGIEQDPNQHYIGSKPALRR